MLDDRDGMIVLRVTGEGVAKAFANEAGGHRWQRVPPTEKRGRMQTSTITVAVLPEPAINEMVLNQSELEIHCIRGSGKGGQARNKTSNAVQMKHIPSGMMVRVESERSQAQNKAAAYVLLRARLMEVKASAASTKRIQDRKQQVGSGMRGDKRRTIRMQDNSVVDHVTGGRMQAGRYLKGYLDEMWGN